MSYVYIISCQRDNGKLPEIYSMWDSYEKAITAYYKACSKDLYNFSFLQIYEFPLNTEFSEIGSWSDIKLGKSCKYRMKFKSMDELKTLVLSTKRDSKLNELGIID